MELRPYLAGRGATSRQPGPSGTFATTTINPVLTLNGENTTVSFSGLIPGLVGVYQVNFAIPVDAPNGDLTLSLVENDLNSNSGLLPVHNQRCKSATVAGHLRSGRNCRARHIGHHNVIADCTNMLSKAHFDQEFLK